MCDNMWVLYHAWFELNLEQAEVIWPRSASLLPYVCKGTKMKRERERERERESVRVVDRGRERECEREKDWSILCKQCVWKD